MPTRDFAVAVARMLADTRCHNVVVMDVTGHIGPAPGLSPDYGRGCASAPPQAYNTPMAGRILVLSAAVGAGHMRAAQAVELALRELAPDAHVQNTDVLTLTNAPFRKVY